MANNMFYVYLLRSKKTDKLYIGFTSNLKKRFADHNLGLNKSTAPSIPWELIYYEAYLDEENAKIREKNLKHFGQTYSQLKSRIGL